ncbi:barrier-to-autointegration factor-like [Littorina saxatilis]|uniref:barrier-to-autointegration factor-like n=1 Tax=Littorina saxatilis TaxID=31220 RepID=UPI0038B5FDAB
MDITQKHRDFAAGPMGKKLVTDLAGIGPILGAKLRDKGFKYAYNVVGQYLVLNKNEEKFKDWLCKKCPADAGQQNDCFNCVKGWCDAHA